MCHCWCERKHCTARFCFRSDHEWGGGRIFQPVLVGSGWEWVDSASEWWNSWWISARVGDGTACRDLPLALLQCQLCSCCSDFLLHKLSSVHPFPKTRIICTKVGAWSPPSSYFILPQHCGQGKMRSWALQWLLPSLDKAPRLLSCFQPWANVCSCAWGAGSVPFCSCLGLAWLGSWNLLEGEEELNPELKAGGQWGARAAVWEQRGKCSCRISTCFFQRENSQGFNTTGSPTGSLMGSNRGNKGQLAIMSNWQCKKQNQKKNCKRLKCKTNIQRVGYGGEVKPVWI